MLITTKWVLIITVSNRKTLLRLQNRTLVSAICAGASECHEMRPLLSKYSPQPPLFFTSRFRPRLLDLVYYTFWLYKSFVKRGPVDISFVTDPLHWILCSI